MINVIIYVLLGLHIVCSALLTLLVLMQRPKSEGLGAAFGGGMTDSLFGAGTSDVLIKMTIALGSFFFGVTLLLAVLYANRTSDALQQKLLSPAAITEPAKQEAPAAPMTPASPETTPATESTGTATAPVENAPAVPATPEQKK